MKLRAVLYLLVSFLIFTKLGAQELKCSFQLNSQKIQGTNRNVFNTLQTAVYEFLNNTPWTQHKYAENERIECTLILTLNEQSGDEYKGTMNLQLRRPVFGTSYNTPILNFLDQNIQFTYIENEKLEFNEAAHQNNLTAILAFYVYIILGYDYDTFSPLGGTEFFEKAQQVVNNAQNATERGWKAYESSKKNRYWIVENMMNDKYRSLRRAMYTYHRRGLDIMVDKLSEGREAILQAITEIQKVYRARPDADMLAIQLFLEAKRDEIANVFLKSATTEKAKAVNIMVDIDRVNAQKYQDLLKQHDTQ
jgi:hypothetical protein